jgi:hypothetical protein
MLARPGIQEIKRQLDTRFRGYDDSEQPDISPEFLTQDTKQIGNKSAIF